MFFVIITVNNIHAQQAQNLVLTSNITVENWKPVDFTNRNLYGNGHTIFIKSFDSAYTGNNYGFFGTVSGNSVIRDVTIVYAVDGNLANTAESNAVTVSHTDNLNFGGIAGTVSGNALLENVLVKGAVRINGSANNPTNSINVGGVVGSMSGSLTRISNAYGGLDLTVNNSSTFFDASQNNYGNTIRIGGISGQITSGTIREVSVVANITVGNEGPVNVTRNAAVSNGGLLIGGFTGYQGGGMLENLDYRSGKITVRCDNGDSIIGGGVGSMYGGSVNRSHALHEGFDITKTGYHNYFYTGGFLGYSSSNINGCYSDNNIVVSSSGSGTISVGGFGGGLGGTVTYCYAKGNVSVYSSNSSGNVYAGGFFGLSPNPASSIQNSYSVGNVTVTGLGTLRAGGFNGAGRALSNCYSLGNVFVDTSGTGDVFAGGLTGQLTSGTFTIANCFATGTVAVHRSGDSGTTYVGGLIGSIGGGSNSTPLVATLQKSAALGTSVTATGSGDKHIARIFGSETLSSTNNTITLTDNRGFNDMRLYVHNTYGASPTIITPVLGNSNANGRDGLDATEGNFLTPSFWTGLGFTNGWNVNTGRRYPLLLNLGGQ